jgi:hypothetical protein
MAVSPNVDSVDVESESFATPVEGNDSHLGTTGNRPHYYDLTITTTDLDSLADGDWLWILLERESSDTGNDTMSNGALVSFVELIEQA